MLGLMLCQTVFSQPVVQYNKSFPIILDKGWKYSEGLDEAWIQPGFDASQWKDINPAIEMHRLLLPDPSKGITLRLKFSGPAFNSDSLYLCVLQAGVSKVYLDGKMIASFGNFEASANNVKAFSPMNSPVRLVINDTPVHILTVQLKLEKDLTYRALVNAANPLFLARLTNIKGAFDLHANQRSRILDFFKVGMFLMLGLIHFIGFLFYPASRVQLFFSIYALTASIGIYILFRQGEVGAVALKLNLNLVFGVVSTISSFFLIAVFSEIFKPLQRKWIITLVVTFILNFMNMVFGVDPYKTILEFITSLATPAFIIWIVSRPDRKKEPEARILFWCSVLFFLFWILFLFSYQIDTPQQLKDVLFHIAAFIFPVSVSMILSLKFRFINNDLEKKMKEVKVLSAEKEQMLISQNIELEEKVKQRTAELHLSLEDLKSTQGMLIQKEKMASLGELTAGIAHEIQNPLNFVNNFSEVNKELLIELKEGIQSGKMDNVIDLTDDLIANEEKINIHGKRADSIVKSMLQHSRLSAGQKEATDINALTDEYLRLSYHGLKAKDKTFNSKLDTVFDPSLPMANIVSQDIGRVLLNLFNNAFYAVMEKSKMKISGYEPLVSVSTSQSGNKIHIKITDNGIGIPANIRDKIFQPFYTTKPTGQGTGLGLSLSYDIVTKGHDGELTVQSSPGEGAVFFITLPF